jgi:hypothetical protein
MKIQRGFSRFVALVLVAASGCSHVMSIPPRAEEAGHHVFYVQDAGLVEDYSKSEPSIDRLKSDLQVLKDTNTRFFRVAISPLQTRTWDQLVVLTPDYRIALLPYFIYDAAHASDLVKFSSDSATRYKGKVHSWEFWVPSDYSLSVTKAEAFAKVLLESAKAIKEIDSEAKIILGGVAEDRRAFFGEVFRYPGISSVVDVIDLGGYLETKVAAPIEDYPRRIKESASLFRSINPKVELWLADFGYGDRRKTSKKVSEGVDAVYDYEHTPYYQGVALWKSHVMALSSEILSLTAWFRARDNGIYGLVDLDNQTTPSYLSFRLYQQLFNRPVRLATDRIRIEQKPNSQVVVEAFEKDNGDWIVTTWLRSSISHDVSDHTGLAEDTRRETVSITLPETSFKDWGFWNLEGSQSKAAPQSAQLKGGRIENIVLHGGEAFVAELRGPSN